MMPGILCPASRSFPLSPSLTPFFSLPPFSHPLLATAELLVRLSGAYGPSSHKKKEMEGGEEKGDVTSALLDLPSPEKLAVS